MTAPAPAIRGNVRYSPDVEVMGTQFRWELEDTYVGLPQSWYEDGGFTTEPFAGLKLEYPISVSAAQFAAVGDRGGERFRRLGEGFLSIFDWPPWQDGAMEEVRTLEQNVARYRRWLKEGAALGIAGAEVPSLITAAGIKTAHGTPSWENQFQSAAAQASSPIFVAAGPSDAGYGGHPVDPLNLAEVGFDGSTRWQNLYANLPLTQNNLIQVLRQWRLRPGPGGKYRNDGAPAWLFYEPSLDGLVRRLLGEWIRPEDIDGVSLGGAGAISRLTTPFDASSGQIRIPSEVSNASGTRLKPLEIPLLAGAGYSGCWGIMGGQDDKIRGAAFQVIDQIPLNDVGVQPGAGTAYVPPTPQMPYRWRIEGPGSSFYLLGDWAAKIPPGFARIGAVRYPALLWRNPARIVVCYPGALPAV